MANIYLAKWLIDGTGRDPIQNAAVIVEDRRIAQVVSQNQVKIDKKQNKIFDFGNGVMLPGLIDCHCHIFSIAGKPSRDFNELKPEELIRYIAGGLESAHGLLNQGVITVRDLGTPNNLDLGLRDLIASGKVTGPRIFGSGKPITMHGASRLIGHAVSSAAEARRAAREQLRAGADVIKLFGSAGIGGQFGELVSEVGWEFLTVEELQAAAFEAHKAGRTVAIHALCPQSIKNAIEAGADTIEHVTFAEEETIEKIKAKGIIMVPTLAIGETVMNHWLTYDKNWFGPQYATHAPLAVKKSIESVKMAEMAGARIATGTDAGSFQDTLMHECDCLHRAGLSPMEVIVAATQNGARALKVQDRLGTIEPGKIADMIVTNGNPLDDLFALERVQWVVKEGQIVKSFNQ